MDELSQFKATYFQECEELLSDMEGHLSALESGDGDADTLHAIFRAVHSIKGGAGAFGFEQLVGFAHTFETVLDRLRSGEMEASQDVVALLLRSNDVLADLVRAAQTGENLPATFGEDAREGLAALIAQGGQEDEEVIEFADFDFVPVAVDFGEVHDDQQFMQGPTERTWSIRFIPSGELLRKANEPLLLLRELRRLGDLTVTADLSRLPSLDGMDPEEAYLFWTMELRTDKPSAEIEEVFEFVRDDCELEISEIRADADHGDDGGSGGETPAAFDIEAAMAAIAAEMAVTDETPTASSPVAEAAPKPERTVEKPPAAKSAEGAAQQASIRVDLEKVDRLVNMVGELVITQAMLAQIKTQLSADQFPQLAQGLEELTHHTRELQESVMAIRAQPIKSVFQRMPRLVRELAAQTGKQVRLVMFGENTEIDKTVIERLADPLTHMIRNAVDHGLEGPEDRLAAGKPVEGTIQLSADHRGGRIVIEIADDGRGIDPNRILSKAIEKGVVASGAGLTEEEIFNLIFAPGFSTADQVSNISGRGVGMDVVKKNIQNAGGRVTIDSVLGKGSTFTLTLPLTLAVLDGMVVAVGGDTFVLPLTNIIECLRPRPSDLHKVVGGGDVLHIRGEYVPIVHLHRLFAVRAAVADPCRGVVVMAESEEGGKVGILVDELLGQQQVVIKSLEANYQPIDGIAAATILGNGRVALILDVSGLRTMSRPVGAAFARPQSSLVSNGSHC